ncbi:Uncharacterised protein [Klebsiella pneumoniae]|nr:Uncharacterised protein [Klebsiella pneumoniae]
MAVCFSLEYRLHRGKVYCAVQSPLSSVIPAGCLFLPGLFHSGINIPGTVPVTCRDFTASCRRTFPSDLLFGGMFLRHPSGDAIRYCGSDNRASAGTDSHTGFRTAASAARYPQMVRHRDRLCRSLYGALSRSAQLPCRFGRLCIGPSGTGRCNRRCTLPASCNG